MPANSLLNLRRLLLRISITICILLKFNLAAEENKPADDSNAKQTATIPTKVEMPITNVSGYFRAMARNDFGYNSNTLGWWPAYGRLLNETPWMTLQLENNIIRPQKDNDPYANITVRVEGGSFRGTDSGFGRLDNYRITQIYLYAENYLLPNSSWQAGTIWYNMGYIGIYDFYISQIFWETAGVRMGQKFKGLEYIVGAGDSGYDIYADRRSNEATANKTKYNSIPTLGGLVKGNLSELPYTKDIFRRFSDNFWLGLGLQLHYEAANEGNPAAPLQTPYISYEEYARGMSLENYLIQNPGQQDQFYWPNAVSAFYFKFTSWLGFNLNFKLGPVSLTWNNLSFSWVKKRPDVAVSETYQNISKDIYISEFTDDRHEIYLVDESIWSILPDRLDAILGLLFSYASDADNTIKPSDANRRIFGAVLRTQYYFTNFLHALAEISITTEKSLNGNAYREHIDSLEKSQNGLPQNDGLEWGDTDTKNTLQIKLGPILNLNGRGINNRPSIRLLFGMQFSNVHAAFGNTFESSLSQRNIFNLSEDVHTHLMVSLEAEHWWGAY